VNRFRRPSTRPARVSSERRVRFKGRSCLAERSRFDRVRNARQIPTPASRSPVHTNTRARSIVLRKDRLPGFPCPRGTTRLLVPDALCGEARRSSTAASRRCPKQLRARVRRHRPLPEILPHQLTCPFCKSTGSRPGRDRRGLIVAYVSNHQSRPIRTTAVRAFSQDSRTCRNIDSTSDERSRGGHSVRLQEVRRAYAAMFATCDVPARSGHAGRRRLGFRAETIDRWRSRSPVHVDRAECRLRAAPCVSPHDRASEHAGGAGAMPDTVADCRSSTRRNALVFAVPG